MTGAELRRLRQVHGLSQAQLAQLLGYSSNYLAILEREAPHIDGTPHTIPPRLARLVCLVLVEHTRSIPPISPQDGL